MPVQHISPRVLKAMGRPADSSHIGALIARLRERIPGLVLRTTVMTGFPGETEEDFGELLAFVRRTRFERLGVFTYSPEEGTRARKLPGAVTAEVAQKRAEAVTKEQTRIAAAYQASLVGGEYDMIVDEYDAASGSAFGRTYHDAPEIDGTVRILSGVDAGQTFCRVRITAAEGYDLTGEVVPWPAE
jgi:ribosomal protein S12 methylthiotransferase